MNKYYFMYCDGFLFMLLSEYYLLKKNLVDGSGGTVKCKKCLFFRTFHHIYCSVLYLWLDICMFNFVVFKFFILFTFQRNNYLHGWVKANIRTATTVR